MLTFQTFATDLLEPKEASRLFQATALMPENMSCEYFEQVVQRTGFEIIHKDIIDSEWRENGLENRWGSLDKSLLRLSRMRRLEYELVREYGRSFYEAAYASYIWNVYQVLGKLCSITHVLKKPLSRSL